MKCLDFDWQINEFMVYCGSTQLRIFTADAELNEAETAEFPFVKTAHINISFPLTFLHLYDKISL